MERSKSFTALFRNAETLYSAFPLKRRIKSSIFIFFFVLIISLSGVFLYNYLCIMDNRVYPMVHRDRPESDYCYQEARLGEIMYGETVASLLFKGTLFEEKMREDAEAQGKPFCYCRRYLVHDQQAGQVYTARASYVGAEAGSIFLNGFSIKRSRLLRILAAQGKNVLMKPEDIPVEYLLPAEIMSTNKTKEFIQKKAILKVTPKKLNVTALNDEIVERSLDRRLRWENAVKSQVKYHHNDSAIVKPADCAVFMYVLSEEFKQRFLSVRDLVLYDYLDVPNFTNQEEIRFFNWSSTLTPVSWNDILFSDLKGFSDGLYSSVSNIREANDPLYTALNEWSIQQPFLLRNATEENDPFLNGVEVCSSYSPRDINNEKYFFREYNLIISSTPLGFPDYSWGICLVGAVMAALGQFFLFPPVPFIS